MPKRKPTDMSNVQKRRPAMTPEAREDQLISYATDLVEQRLLNGTASSQEVVHFLKLGCSKERLEQEKLRLETELVRAKTEAIKAQQHSEELFADAIAAMKKYSGNDDLDDLEEEEFDDDYY